MLDETHRKMVTLMTSLRIDRIKAFDEFREKSKEIFNSYADTDNSNKRLDGLYSLCICPGGRDGGLNKKLVEVFYGNRPIDSVIEVSRNFRTITRLETAQGATLAYFRTDDGNVICNLYPSKSENQRPSEEVILLDYVTDPRLLRTRSKRHWKSLIAYMEATCIDGLPNIKHKIRVFYLRNFKRYVVGSVEQSSKALNLVKDLSKYVLTIGLSGFLILLITMFKGNIDSRRADAQRQEVLGVSRKALDEISNISKRIERIDQKLALIAKTLQSRRSDSNDFGDKK